MYEPYIGTLMYFATPYEFRSWIPCDGRSLPTSKPYDSLFALIKYTYGRDGDRFRVPDLRGRSLVSMGPTYPLGIAGGQENTTLNADTTPAHTHIVNAKIKIGTAANAPNATGNFFAKNSGAGMSYASAATTPAAYAADLKVGVDNIGAAASFSNMNPYQVIPICIAYQGIYPSKD